MLQANHMHGLSLNGNFAKQSINLLKNAFEIALQTNKQMDNAISGVTCATEKATWF